MAPLQGVRYDRGKTYYLWRVVDQTGNVVDVLVTSRHDANAATKFLPQVTQDPMLRTKGGVTDN